MRLALAVRVIVWPRQMVGLLGEMETPPVEGGTAMLKSEGFVRQEPAPVQVPQRVLLSEPVWMRRV
jgi:hypothetical protein